MPKERNYNPIQAQRKADKKKEVKKGKAEVAARRNGKLARKNPTRLQKQIDDLKKIPSSGGKLTKHEEAVLAGLETELKAVNKAREALGDKAPTFSSGGFHDGGGGRDGRDGGVLGKRRRRDDEDSDDSDIPEDVRKIPMPRDTPPPIPKEEVNAWHARRRARWQARNQERLQRQEGERQHEPGSQAEAFQQRGGQGGERRGPVPPAAPIPVVAKTVYESAPQVRDLRKEAVTAFVPVAVRAKLDKGKGVGGLIEPEEADALEREGYMKPTQGNPRSRNVTMEDVEDDG